MKSKYYYSHYLTFYHFYKTNEPKTSRKRFGAWYLPKNLWHMAPANEKLIDPKLAVDKSKEESQKKIDEMVSNDRI